MKALVLRPLPRTSELALLVTVVVGSLGLARLALEPQLARVLLAVSLIFLTVAVSVLARVRLLYALVVWLVALGFTRRVVSEFITRGEADPLLLVAPVALIVLAAVAASRGAFHAPTGLSNAVLALSLLAALSALNPLQGGLMTGLAGLLFILVPTLAFWVGRSLVDDRVLQKVLALVGVLGLVAAAYGMAQTFSGFLPWDQHWIDDHGYASLSVHAEDAQSTTRPFSTFSSSAEYVTFTAIAIVVWVGVFLRRRAVLALAAAALLALALLYGSSRGIVVTLLAALVLMAGARRGAQPLATLFAAAALIVALPVALQALVPSTYGAQGASTLLAHQVQGLADPLDPESSTLGVHASLLWQGLRTVVSDPLGAGVGVVTIASSKFGGTRFNTELDPSNVAVAMGLPGLLVYGIIFALGFRKAYLTAARRRDALSTVALGILAVTVFQWLTGGQYAVALLPWLLLGWLDRPVAAPRAERQTPD